MRIFAREWVSGLLQRLGMEEGVPIESGMISKRIEAAQKAVETQNFESRKHVLEYDDVMNKQREAVYGLRRQLMEGVDQKQLITEDYTGTILSNILDEFAPEKTPPAEWKMDKVFEAIFDIFGARFAGQGAPAQPALPAEVGETGESSELAVPATTPNTIPLDLDSLSRHELGETLYERIRARYDVKEQILGAPAMRYHERIVMLSVLDGLWKDHLLAMDHLKEGIGLRSYAQQDPLVAYKKESFDMFEAMMLRFQEDTARHLFRMQIIGPDGQPIETPEQLAMAQYMQQQIALAQQQAQMQVQMQAQQALQQAALQAQQAAAQLPAPPSAPAPAPAPAVPTRAPSTTIDALEREFQKKKARELEMSRQAGASATATATAPRKTGEKVGRNDKCPCGSGKKYKACHGVNA
jgi:preprotein translocase subunit SecA